MAQVKRNLLFQMKTTKENILRMPVESGLVAGYLMCLVANREVATELET